MSIRRREYFIPVGILLKAFMDVRDHEIFERMLGGCLKGFSGSFLLDDCFSEKCLLSARTA